MDIDRIMQTDQKDSICAALAGLEVETLQASLEFKEWISDRFVNWVFIDDFCRCIPRNWGGVFHDGYDLCFLANAATIRETSMRLDSSMRFREANLLPVGALMEGSLLLLDTKATDKIAVGSLGSGHVLSTPDSQIDPAHFRSFPLSYVEWLRHIKMHPEDSRFL